MRRAGQRLVIALVVLCAPSLARAFHTGSLFDKAPGAGGAGGLFFTGARVDKKWDCRACHIKAESRIRVRLSAPGLFDQFRYRSGSSYSITLTIEGEHRGLASTRSNFNGFALRILDANGKAAGEVTGFSAEEIFQGGPTTIATAGKKVGQTSWTFTWNAQGSGAVTFWIGAVDGDGAGSAPDVTLNDPFGDDVFVGSLTVEEQR